MCKVLETVRDLHRRSRSRPGCVHLVKWHLCKAGIRIPRPRHRASKCTEPMTTPDDLLLETRGHALHVVVEHEVMGGMPCLAQRVFLGSNFPRCAACWLAENIGALESSNTFAEQHGLPLAKYRAPSNAGFEPHCPERPAAGGYEAPPASYPWPLHADGADSRDLPNRTGHMLQPESPDARPDAAADADLFTGAFIVRIAALEPQRVITAVITPLNLGTGESKLTAIVSWEGIETVSSSVGLEVDAGPERPDAWSRFLLLLWAVFGPTTLPEPEAFGPGRWSSIVLSTQELDGESHHSVVVVIDRAHQAARLLRSDPTRPGAEVRMDAHLPMTDAGSALVEMTSRLILGRPWL